MIFERDEQERLIDVEVDGEGGVVRRVAVDDVTFRFYRPAFRVNEDDTGEGKRTDLSIFMTNAAPGLRHRSTVRLSAISARTNNQHESAISQRGDSLRS